MYAPDAFAIEEEEHLWRFIEDNPFAAMITHEGGFFATHIPFSVERPENQGDENFRLMGHIAAANPHKTHLEGGEVLLIFQGPHGYISPSWYTTRQAVPTWNYATVHVWGTANCFSDAARLEAVVRSLSDRFETTQEQPWTLDELAASSRKAMLKQITGVEISVRKIAGKFKMSQNRTTDDREAVMQTLSVQDRFEGQALAKFMAEISENGRKQ